MDAVSKLNFEKEKKFIKEGWTENSLKDEEKDSQPKKTSTPNKKSKETENLVNPGVFAAENSLFKIFWETRLKEIEELPLKEKSFRPFPLTSIKKLMNNEMSSSIKPQKEAGVVIAKAAELFLLEVLVKAYLHSSSNSSGSVTINKASIASALQSVEEYDFLLDFVKDSLPKNEVPSNILDLGKWQIFQKLRQDTHPDPLYPLDQDFHIEGSNERSWFHFQVCCLRIDSQVKFNVFGHFRTGSTLGYIESGTVEKNNEPEILFNSSQELFERQKLKFTFSASTLSGKFRGIGEASFEKTLLIVILKYVITPQKHEQYIYICTNSQDKNSINLEESIRSDMNEYNHQNVESNLKISTLNSNINPSPSIAKELNNNSKIENSNRTDALNTEEKEEKEKEEKLKPSSQKKKKKRKKKNSKKK